MAKIVFMNTALLLIDLQNDYFPGGLFPLWNTDGVLANIKEAIGLAKARGVSLIHIQHIADPAMGLTPFFNKGTKGAEIHSDVLAAAPDAPIVVKAYADTMFLAQNKVKHEKRKLDGRSPCFRVS